MMISRHFMWSLYLLYLGLGLVTGQGETCPREGCAQGDKTGSHMLKTAVILGASGETGRQLLQQLVASPHYAKVISLGRRQLDLPKEGTGNWDKLEQRLVDFERLEEQGSLFPRVDSAFICLGTTRAKAGAEGFVRVDHDYVLAAARQLMKAGTPDLHLLTSKGANPDSYLLYPQTKGLVEQGVISLDFPSLTVYRPGLLLTPRKETRLVESLAQWVASLTDPYSWWSVTTTNLASAMLKQSLQATQGLDVLEHHQIVAIAQRDQ